MPSQVHNIIQSLETQEVRELVWAIGSAPLLSRFPFRDENIVFDTSWYEDRILESEDWIRALDRAPHELTEHLERPPRVPLGKRFERLLSFYFNHSPRFEMIWEGKQVVDDKTTLGEMDFLVADLKDEKVYHIEVACKFYLSSNNRSDWNTFLGPNAKDCLADKMKKFHRQFDLSYHPLVQEALKERDVQHFESRLFLKGFIFHHFTLLQKARPHQWASDRYSSGWYCFVHELPSLLHDKAEWYILEKKNWLSTIHPAYISDEILTSEELRRKLSAHFIKSTRAQLLVQVILMDAVYIELSRGFVLDDRWPNLKAKGS
jgi:hypothetical protein